MSSPVGRPGITSIPVTAATADERPPEPSPVANSTAATGWVAGGGQAGEASAPNSVDQLVNKARGKVLKLAIDAAASNHSIKKGVSFGQGSANLKLSERIALQGSKTYREVVANDRRRSEYATSHADAAWVQLRVLAEATGNVGVGAGVSLGFTGSVEITSVMAQQVESLKDAAGAAASEAKSLLMPVDGEGLLGLAPAPGSEWLIRGLRSGGVSVGVGASSTTGAGPFQLAANLGVTAGVNKLDVYTKNVKVLEGNLVYVQVARQDATTATATLGARLNLEVNANDPVATPIGAGTVGSAVGGSAGAGNSVEKTTRLEATISASTTLPRPAPHTLIGAAVLDLSNPTDRAAYDFILRSDPEAAADFIKAQRLGAKYTEAARALSTAVTLKFGSKTLIANSTIRGTAHGVLEEPGGTTLLSEASYGRNIGGVLPRLALGEERTVAIHAGSVTKGDATQQAISVSLTTQDPKMTAGEAAQLARFSQAMGTPLVGLPADRDLGKAATNVQVALTDENVAKLRQWDADSLKLAFANAQREIEGGQTLPPYYSNPASFNSFKDRLRWPVGDHDADNHQRVLADYKAAFPGRDLEKDVASQKAITLISKQVIEMHGLPVEKWASLLEAVGKQQSNDVRAALLALRRLSGAEVVRLSVNAHNVNAMAKPEVSAPMTLSELVGPVLAPPP